MATSEGGREPRGRQSPSRFRPTAWALVLLALLSVVLSKSGRLSHRVAAGRGKANRAGEETAAFSAGAHPLGLGATTPLLAAASAPRTPPRRLSAEASVSSPAPASAEASPSLGSRLISFLSGNPKKEGPDGLEKAAETQTPDEGGSAAANPLAAAAPGDEASPAVSPPSSAAAAGASASGANGEGPSGAPSGSPPTPEAPVQGQEAQKPDALERAETSTKTEAQRAAGSPDGEKAASSSSSSPSPDSSSGAETPAGDKPGEHAEASSAASQGAPGATTSPAPPPPAVVIPAVLQKESDTHGGHMTLTIPLEALPGLASSGGDVLPPLSLDTAGSPVTANGSSPPFPSPTAASAPASGESAAPNATSAHVARGEAEPAPAPASLPPLQWLQALDGGKLGEALVVVKARKDESEKKGGGAKSDAELAQVLKVLPEGEIFREGSGKLPDDIYLISHVSGAEKRGRRGLPLAAQKAIGGDDGGAEEGATTPASSLEDLSSNEREMVLSAGLLTLLLVLSVSLVLSHVSRKCRLRWLQMPVCATLLGLLVGAVLKFGLKVQGPILGSVLAMNEDVFFVMLLPPIIFEGGLSLSEGSLSVPFMRNFGAIMWLACFCTILSFCWVGAFMFFGGVLGLSMALTVRQAFAFGALISSTDPVSVLALFKDLHAKKIIHALVFGESLLNDAISIVLYRTIASEDTASVGSAILAFFLTFFVSLAIGLAVGFSCALTYKYMDLHKQENQTLESALLLLFPWMAYLVADGAGYSGIVAICFCGVTIGKYAVPNLSASARATSRSVFNSFALLAETVVFVFLGLAVFSFDQPRDEEFSVGLYVLGFIATFSARAVSVYVTCAIINLFRATAKITPSQQLALVFCGLRGAIAFALSERAGRDFGGKEGAALLSLTLYLALFTILVLGPSLVFILDRLGIFEKRSPHRASSLGGWSEAGELCRSSSDFSARRGVPGGAGSDEDEIGDDEGSLEAMTRGTCGGLKRLLLQMDRKFMIPLFTHSDGRHDPPVRASSRLPRPLSSFFLSSFGRHRIASPASASTSSAFATFAGLGLSSKGFSASPAPALRTSPPGSARSLVGQRMRVGFFSSSPAYTRVPTYAGSSRSSAGSGSGGDLSREASRGLSWDGLRRSLGVSSAALAARSVSMRRTRGGDPEVQEMAVFREGGSAPRRSSQVGKHPSPAARERGEDDGREGGWGAAAARSSASLSDTEEGGERARSSWRRGRGASRGDADSAEEDVDLGETASEAPTREDELWRDTRRGRNGFYAVAEEGKEGSSPQDFSEAEQAGLVTVVGASARASPQSPASLSSPSSALLYSPAAESEEPCSGVYSEGDSRLLRAVRAPAEEAAQRNGGPLPVLVGRASAGAGAAAGGGAYPVVGLGDFEGGGGRDGAWRGQKREPGSPSDFSDFGSESSGNEDRVNNGLTEVVLGSERAEANWKSRVRDGGERGRRHEDDQAASGEEKLTSLENGAVAEGNGDSRTVASQRNQRDAAEDRG
ncbi:Na+/H+ exchanger NHE3 [Besnoitia besnoiti]|uniref:Na+/H+ exchanger NHE3 n=1 Tax=Besnoitia besnoiti TaxID=94643 RepID=A0A2A9M818_BESBE|nr:Na+/H+ exchanger NHE3 [Besnoitia besnoiti]PFH32431.1 Na+/H+ exchanger NHE3 [Besnoitia besnoiti]